jgi:hypothetical protein
MDYLVSGSAPDVATAVVPHVISGGVAIPQGTSAPGVVTPMLTSGGHATVQTAATGTNYTALSAQACKQLTFLNNTGTAIGVRVGSSGAEVPVFDQSYYTFYGLTDASNLQVRRVDTSNSQVTVAYRWEA